MSPTFSIILETLEIGFFQFSPILEMWAAGGRLQGLGSGGLGLFLESVPGNPYELRSAAALRRV